jgi:hypothetical protein
MLQSSLSTFHTNPILVHVFWWSSRQERFCISFRRSAEQEQTPHLKLILNSVSAVCRLVNVANNRKGVGRWLNPIGHFRHCCWGNVKLSIRQTTSRRIRKETVNRAFWSKHITSSPWGIKKKRKMQLCCLHNIEVWTLSTSCLKPRVEDK